MFPLHDKTRRRLLLAAFFAFCVAPTVIVLGLGIARHLPGHVRAEAGRLSWQLGQEVSLGRVRHLRPGVVRYEGIEVSDPETGRRILRCRSLEARWAPSTDTTGQSRPLLVLRVSLPEIEAAELTQLWRCVEKVVTCRAGRPEGEVRLVAEETTVRFGKTSQRLTGVQGRIERLPTRTQADLSFRIAGVDSPEPVQIRVTRTHQAAPPATGLGLYTGGGALPCSWLASGLDAWSRLGPRSRFRGHFWANGSPDGWSGELVGEFTDVDLERLTAGRFPHTVRGTAQWTIRSAQFSGGRLEEADGWLIGGPGVVSRPLLDAAADRMGMVRGLGLEEPGDPVSYEQLALSFRINSRGLLLRGHCPPSDSGTILLGGHGVLLGEPVLQPASLAALIETLLPADGARVPATRETDWLMRRLPVPYAFLPREAGAPAASGAPTRAEAVQAARAGGAGPHVSNR